MESVRKAVAAGKTRDRFPFFPNPVFPSPAPAFSARLPARTLTASPDFRTIFTRKGAHRVKTEVSIEYCVV